MKIVIVGAGASGLILSLALKENNPHVDVVVIEHNNKIAKKMYATGNGKCNLANNIIHEDSYNNEFAINILNVVNLNNIEQFYKNNGIVLSNINDLIYPANLNSETTIHILENHAKELGVVFCLEEDVIDYNQKEIITNRSHYSYDKLVFACGLCSAPKLGSDGHLVDVFKKHNYKISEIIPGLCPIKCRENNSLISGLRHDANVTLYSKNYQYSETGEVLFKNDGLSGIVIFNIASLIARRKLNDALISLDFFPNVSINGLIKEFFDLNKSKLNFLDGYFHHSLSTYLLKRLDIKEKNYYSLPEITELAHLVKNMPFHYQNNYSFDNSQVSIGGISINNINNDLSSKIEKNVYFIGEILDIDGLCGGYNLMWAASSAIYLSNIIK